MAVRNGRLESSYLYGSFSHCGDGHGQDQQAVFTQQDCRAGKLGPLTCYYVASYNSTGLGSRCHLGCKCASGGNYMEVLSWWTP
jgi:hypothetical protein